MYIATSLMLLLFFHGKFKYAYCRNTVTVAGGLAGTNIICPFSD